MRCYARASFPVEDGPASERCTDPLQHHRQFESIYGEVIPWAQKEDVDEVLDDLAWILDGARAYNYIEVANTFPISCQAMVAQFDETDNESGVSYFCHTRTLPVCKMCLHDLRSKLTRFRDENAEIMNMLVEADLSHLLVKEPDLDE